jgi:hypothetical protein
MELIYIAGLALAGLGVVLVAGLLWIRMATHAND